MYETGDGVARNENLAAQYFIEGCNLNESSACGHAVPYLDKSCQSGDLDGCMLLGSIVEDGRGVQADALSAISMYQAACDGGNYDGCMTVARVYIKGGRGVPPNPEKGVAIFLAGCNDGHSRACAGLGSAYIYGRGVPEDATQALLRQSVPAW